jgi:two-component system NtrC family response regulator
LAVRFGAKGGSEDQIFTPEALTSLTRHTWPGNVRELANVIEHAMILCDGKPITPEHLPRRFDSRRIPSRTSQPTGPCSLRELEMRAIHEALDRHHGNKPRAAEELGISLKTLYNKLNQAASLSKSA